MVMGSEMFKAKNIKMTFLIAAFFLVSSPISVAHNSPPTLEKCRKNLSYVVNYCYQQNIAYFISYSLQKAEARMVLGVIKGGESVPQPCFASYTVDTNNGRFVAKTFWDHKINVLPNCSLVQWNGLVESQTQMTTDQEWYNIILPGTKDIMNGLNGVSDDLSTAGDLSNIKIEPV